MSRPLGNSFRIIMPELIAPKGVTSFSTRGRGRTILYQGCGPVIGRN